MTLKCAPIGHCCLCDCPKMHADFIGIFPQSVVTVLLSCVLYFVQLDRNSFHSFLLCLILNWLWCKFLEKKMWFSIDKFGFHFCFMLFRFFYLICICWIYFLLYFRNNFVKFIDQTCAWIYRSIVLLIWRRYAV